MLFRYKLRYVFLVYAQYQLYYSILYISHYPISSKIAPTKWTNSKVPFSEFRTYFRLISNMYTREIFPSFLIIFVIQPFFLRGWIYYFRIFFVIIRPVFLYFLCFLFRFWPTLHFSSVAWLCLSVSFSGEDGDKRSFLDYTQRDYGIGPLTKSEKMYFGRI